MKKSKVLLIAEGVTLAHVARIIALSEEIDPEKFQIQFAFDQRFKNFLPPEAIFFHLASITPDHFMKSVNNYKFPYTENILVQYVEDDLALLEKLQPDLVIGDFRISLAISSKKLKVPYVTMTNGYWLPDFPLSLNPPDHPILNLLPLKFAKAIFKLIKPLAFWVEARPFNQVATRFGVPQASGSLLKVYTQADHVFAVEPEGWLPLKNTENVTFVGPLKWAPQTEMPSWWPQIDWKKPSIFISAGSSGSEDILKQVIDATADLEVQIVFSGWLELRDEFKTKNKLFMGRLLPNKDVLAHASLFISNGGSMSMVDALANGKAVIGLTSNYDQYLNANLIEFAGVGMAFKQNRVLKNQLSSVIKRFLSADEMMTKKLRQAQCLFSKTANRRAINSQMTRLIVPKPDIRS